MSTSGSSTAGYKTFEVFVQWDAGDPFEHVGEVESADHDTALLAAKEHFVRRDKAVGIWVVNRHDVHAAHWGGVVLNAGNLKRYRRSLGSSDSADILADKVSS